MNVNHWKEKFNQKTDSELKTISESNGHQETARIAATELLQERGFSIEIDNQQAPELLTKKNDLQYLLNRLKEHGYNVNFTNEKNFKITKGSGAKITGLGLLFLGVIILTFSLAPIVIAYMNDQPISTGRNFWVIAASIGMIGTGWYRYFNAHGYRVELANNNFIVEEYIGNGETLEHKHPISDIDHFFLETEELDDDERTTEYYFNCQLKDNSWIHFLNIQGRTSKMTKEYAEFLLEALNQQVTN